MHKVGPTTCAAPCWQQAAAYCLLHNLGTRACATPSSRGAGVGREGQWKKQQEEQANVCVFLFSFSKNRTKAILILKF